MEKRSEACDGKERRTVMKRVEETKSLRVVPASRVKKRCSRVGDPTSHLLCVCVCVSARGAMVKKIAPSASEH